MKTKFVTFSEYLKKARKSKGLTQAQLAKKLGYTAQFVTNWERGVSMPPIEKLGKVAKICSVSGREIADILIQQYEQKLKKALKI